MVWLIRHQKGNVLMESKAEALNECLRSVFIKGQDVTRVSAKKYAHEIQDQIEWGVRKAN